MGLHGWPRGGGGAPGFQRLCLPAGVDLSTIMKVAPRASTDGALEPINALWQVGVGPHHLVGVLVATCRPKGPCPLSQLALAATSVSEANEATMLRLDALCSQLSLIRALGPRQYP